MKPALLKSIIFLIVGAFCIYWAQTHAPGHVGEQLLKKAAGSYSLTEPWYYGTMIVGAVIALYGALGIFKSLK